MKRTDDIENDAFAKAAKKLKLVKGFYRHLTLFLLFILFLVIDVLIQNTTDIGSLFGPIAFIPTIFYWGPWAMSIVIHGIIVFDVVSIFKGKDWEERNVKKIIKEDVEQHNPIRWE